MSDCADKRPTPVTFRHATRADTAALTELKLAINVAEYAAYNPKSGIPALLDLSREAAALGVEDYWTAIERDGGAFLVGVDGDQIVCAGCWYGETAAVSTLAHLRKQAGIGGIIVTPAARGLGLGRKIMLELEALIRVAGYRHVRLTVVPGNQAAEQLYSSLGFEPFETVMIKPLD